MACMMNYQDTNQSQQEYANNDDFTCNNGRHKKLLLLPHAQSKVSDNLSCIKILVNYIFNIFVNFLPPPHGSPQALIAVLWERGQKTPAPSIFKIVGVFFL